MNISLTLHIVGIVMWLGSLIVLTRVLALGAKQATSIEVFKTIANKIFYVWSLPGAVLVIITGLYQLLYHGMSYYFSQGWFHGKVTFVIVLLVATLVLFFKVQEIQEDKWPKVGTLMAVHGMTGLSLVLIVGLTILGR